MPKETETMLSPTDQEIDRNKRYTADELELFLARKMANYQIHEIERNVGRLTGDVQSSYAEFRVTLDNISKQIDKQNDQITSQIKQCRDDIETQMEKEYPNITEFKVLETKVGNLVTKEEFRVFSARASVIYAVIMIVIVYGPGWLKLLGTG